MAATVHVVEDDDSARTAVIRLLQSSGYEAIGYASAGDFLLRRHNAEQGCLLLDMLMPGPSGLDLQASMRDSGITLPIIFMTGYPEVSSCVMAMRRGAIDYLAKPVEPTELLAAVSSALSKDGEARARRQELERLRASFSALSQRERQVLELVVAGKLNKQIADTLNVAERTVKAWRASVMEKMGTDSAAGLGQLAERLRLLESIGG
jgi:FixJ family two-component response regulator